MVNRQDILLAEDDRDEVYLVQWAIKHAGLPHEVIHAPDGEATIDYLRGKPPFDDRGKHPLPKLLILDLKMPKINGFNVLAWLATRPDLEWLPAVVLTSSAFEADVQLATKLGAREFLTKPTDIDDLVRIMKGLHDRWLAADSALRSGPAAEVQAQSRWAPPL